MNCFIYPKENLAKCFFALYTRKKYKSTNRKEPDMKYTYKTHGTCSTLIELELEGNVVHNVVFTGGCHGNLQAIPKLVEGLTVEEVEARIKGISCRGRGTSCGDEALEASQK